MVQPAPAERLPPGIPLLSALSAVRHGDLDVVGGLVRRMVVDREPGAGRLGLTHRDRAVRRAQEAVHPELRAADRLRHPLVDHLDGEPAVLRQPAGRGDDQFVAVPLVAGGGAVDPHRGDRQAGEVQVEPGQVGGRGGGDQGGAGQPVGGRVVAHLELVAGHVVAAVAVGREVRVADAGRTGREPAVPAGRSRGVPATGATRRGQHRSQRDGADRPSITEHRPLPPVAHRPEPRRPRCRTSHDRRRPLRPADLNHPDEHGGSRPAHGPHAPTDLAAHRGWRPGDPRRDQA